MAKPFIEIQKEINELRPGDVLGENIREFPMLKKGSVLDQKKIDILARLKTGNVITWEIKDKSISIDDIKNWQEGNSTEYSKKITSNIKKIIDSKKDPKKKEYKVLIEKFKPEHRKEAIEIIQHVECSKRDIQIIEAGPKLPIREINKTITDKVKFLSKILSEMIINKTYNFTQLKNIVSNLIDETGPKQDSSFLLSSLKRKGTDFIVKHSINTCLISLAIAIELSKMMEVKIQDPIIFNDLKKLAICNQKMFVREELVDLGISALLHDICLKEHFPNLKEDSILTPRDRLIVQRHSSDAFHFLQKLGVEFSIRKAIFQHHEYLDGTGYPEGVNERFMTKFSKTLSFANRYELLTSKNPFENKLNPRNAILKILTSERNKFDDDVIYSFCKAASLYPIGSWVALDNNSISLVFRSNKNNLERPVVKSIYNGDLRELTNKEFIDLNQENIKIQEIVDVESIELIDPRCERFVFEEREFDRMAVDLNAYCIIQSSSIKFPANITDISGGGAKIICSKALSLGMVININFNFEGTEFENISGLIIWQNPENKGINLSYGLRFTHILLEDKKYIIEKITEKTKSPLA